MTTILQTRDRRERLVFPDKHVQATRPIPIHPSGRYRRVEFPARPTMTAAP